MNCIDIKTINRPDDLVKIAQGENEPIIVLDGEDECLVAMRPAVFERILFDSDLLNFSNRESLRF